MATASEMQRHHRISLDAARKDVEALKQQITQANQVSSAPQSMTDALQKAAMRLNRLQSVDPNQYEIDADGNILRPLTGIPTNPGTSDPAFAVLQEFNRTGIIPESYRQTAISQGYRAPDGQASPEVNTLPFVPSPTPPEVNTLPFGSMGGVLASPLQQGVPTAADIEADFKSGWIPTVEEAIFHLNKIGIPMASAVVSKWQSGGTGTIVTGGRSVSEENQEIIDNLTPAPGTVGPSGTDFATFVAGSGNTFDPAAAAAAEEEAFAGIQPNNIIPNLPSGVTDGIREQRGFPEVARAFALGSGVSPEFRGLLETAVGRQKFPFAVQSALGNFGFNDMALADVVVSPQAFESFLTSGARGMPTMFGNARDSLRQAADFLRKPNDDSVFGGQSTLLDVLRGDAAEGSVGMDLFDNVINQALQPSSKRFLPGLGQSARMGTKNALENLLARDPGRFTTFPDFIDFLGSKGLV